LAMEVEVINVWCGLPLPTWTDAITIVH
jgi:hypothetical protein